MRTKEEWQMARPSLGEKLVLVLNTNPKAPEIKCKPLWMRHIKEILKQIWHFKYLNVFQLRFLTILLHVPFPSTLIPNRNKQSSPYIQAPSSEVEPFNHNENKN